MSISIYGNIPESVIWEGGELLMAIYEAIDNEPDDQEPGEGDYDEDDEEDYDDVLVYDDDDDAPHYDEEYYY